MIFDVEDEVFSKIHQPSFHTEHKIVKEAILQRVQPQPKKGLSFKIPQDQLETSKNTKQSHTERENLHQIDKAVSQ